MSRDRRPSDAVAVAPRKVLFLCTANSARSQMAEALTRHLAAGRPDGDPGRALLVASAGTEPAGLHPLAVEAMRERGIDITGRRSKPLNEFLDTELDEVITVCSRADRSCPVFPGPVRRRHWPIEDPAAVEGDHERRLAAFRSARDELERRIGEWLDRRSHEAADDSA